MGFGQLKANQEIEIKLEIVDKSQVEYIEEYIQKQASKEFKKIQMKAIYYDTVDECLQKQKVAYRVRQENDCFVATYKSGKINEQNVFERVEINKDVKNMKPDISVFVEETEIWPKLKAIKNSEFKPIVITDFVRKCTDISWNKSMIELALDIGFVQGKEQQAPLYEVELELKSGTIDDLLAYKQKLEEKFKLVASPVSKYKKGLILAGQI